MAENLIIDKTNQLYPIKKPHHCVLLSGGNKIPLRISGNKLKGNLPSYIAEVIKIKNQYKKHLNRYHFKKKST
jgi:hypothetical protein